jgi:4-amino-4-deoxy-L-arabinose transferase-like glycosyltransferase
VETRGHYLSYYPIVTPILITPLYVIPYILLKLTHYPIDMFNPGFVSIVYMSEKLSASLIAAISGIFVFLFLKHLLNRKTALICAIIYAFATNTWSISSQGLWQQGLVELLLSIILYILIKNENSNSNINYIYLGGLTGLLVFNRPVDCLILLPIIYYIAQSQRKNIISYLIAALLSGFPFALYNFYYFNNLFGGYGNLLSQFSLSSASFVGFMGLLISPSRGLFVYSPILILSLFGFLKISRISNMKFKNLLKLFVFSILIQVTVYSCFRVWWSGWSYGPRFLIGMLPILTLFLGLYLTDYVSDKTWGRRGKITTFFIFLLVIISIFVQIVGVFYYPNGNWDGEPDNVDLHPERLWDINDSQITRSLSAGIMGPEKPIKYLQNIWEYWELSYDLVIVESLFWASCPEI